MNYGTRSLISHVLCGEKKGGREPLASFFFLPDRQVITVIMIVVIFPKVDETNGLFHTTVQNKDRQNPSPPLSCNKKGATHSCYVKFFLLTFSKCCYKLSKLFDERNEHQPVDDIFFFLFSIETCRVDKSIQESICVPGKHRKAGQHSLLKDKKKQQNKIPDEITLRRIGRECQLNKTQKKSSVIEMLVTEFGT